MTSFAYPNSSSRQMNESHNQVLGSLSQLNLMGMSSSSGDSGMMSSGNGPRAVAGLPGVLAALANENIPPVPIVHRAPVNPSGVRTPLSLLNEICTKAGANPKFEIQAEGPVHKPAFDCVVKVERESYRWEARGRGFSKKDAKQDAARALLQSMDERTEKLLTPLVKAPREETPEPDVDPDVVGNPVGDLNDLCMRVRISPPKYESVGEEGKPHARVYFVECSLTSKIKETGRGRNKKHAKRVAASAVLKILHDTGKLNGEIASIFGKDELEQLTERMGALQTNFTKYFKDLACTTPEIPKRAVDFVQSFLSLCGQKVETLGKMTQKDLTKCDFLLLLKEISEEQNFTIEWFDMGIQSDDPRHRCFVYFNSNPVLLRLGTGSNPSQAQKSAAYEVLEFVRNVIHK